MNNLTATNFVEFGKVFSVKNYKAFIALLARYDYREMGLEDFVEFILGSNDDVSKPRVLHLMNEELQILINKKLSTIEVGRVLFVKIIEKYRSSNFMIKAGQELELCLPDGTFILNSQKEWMYIVDFAIHDFYYKITKNMLIKYKMDDQDLLNVSTNLLERYRIFHGDHLNKIEKILLDEWIDRRLSIFEIVRVEHPLILVKDLLNEDIHETIYDFHFSQTAIPGMIMGMRLIKSGRLGATSGISFLFDSIDKESLLNEWELYRKKHNKNKRINRLLFPFLFVSQKKFGIPITSSLFLK